MFGIPYFKADSSTFVFKTVKGRVRQKGKGLSFFYNAATTSIATVPVNAQEAPFIFNLQSADFQTIQVQGQISYRIIDPERTAEMLNFTLKADGKSYVSEDPLTLSDRVIRSVQTIIQNKVQASSLRQALKLGQTLVQIIKTELYEQTALSDLGVSILDTSITAISPTKDTSRALEAEVRESILKESDDAIYARRKSAVEQELTIKEAELQTALTVQTKEQEIAESRMQNERTLLRAKAETARERLEGEIAAEQQRKGLVVLSVENRKQEADAEAYATTQQMKAFRELPVENLKALALANMQPEQLMAVAFEALAQNAAKIGELNISPDMFSQMMKKAAR
ncbi:SPFH domain-containing protein [Leucothrix mucor]|jgi:regulator of protease activity HflC (stomatin/prohibitin superfamily)|uniref:SPFH domain-containing protein n=1 Tax=Leucothrix mucor TaxID=45248 RepID=UPI0003B45E13|nr:SPFH domain-containing protein [Leucothrix mucor]